MLHREKFEMGASPCDPRTAAMELYAAWRTGRIAWTLDQLSYLTPFQSAAIAVNMARCFQRDCVESTGFFTLLNTRAKHGPEKPSVETEAQAQTTCG